MMPFFRASLTPAFFRRLLVSASSAVCLAAGMGVSPAHALQAAPQWTVTSVARPTNLTPGDQTGKAAYVVTLTNTGGASSDATQPITITDELPVGLSAAPGGPVGENPLAGKGTAANTGANFSCVLSSCVYSGVVIPDQTLVITFPVDVSTSPPASCQVPAGATSCVQNVVRVDGGGAPSAVMETPTTVAAGPATFGVSPGGASTALSSTQAGAHPDITTSIWFNTVNAQGQLADQVKETVDDLPAGYAGADLADTPSCPAAVFVEEQCPVATQIGVATVTLRGLVTGAFIEPVFNLTPDPGEAAKLGFWAGKANGGSGTGSGQVPVEGGVTLRSDYGPRVLFNNIDQAETELDGVSLTVWGVPPAAIHDQLRLSGGTEGSPSSAPNVPFFTNPTSCGGTLSAQFEVASWQHPEHSEAPPPTPMPFGQIVGCDRLTLEPSLTAEPTTPFASSASGLNVLTTMPQTYNNPEGLATAQLERAVVTLPEGMTVNPSAGAGLGACSIAELEEEQAVEQAGEGCPNNSKLGTIRAKSPALKEEAEGSVFLAQPAPNGEPGRNPFSSLLALYIVARIPNRGILVKAAGEVTANPLTGQLVTTFDTSLPGAAHDGLPPVPIETLLFKFRQGATSPLVTPPTCGNYQVLAAITPWSDATQVLAPAIPPFPITGAFDGGACPTGTPPFAPRVSAGTIDNNAAAYSPIAINITRNDGEQEITRFSAKLPAGLTANLSGVPFCPDASIQAAKARSGASEEAEPSCPAASLIGHTEVNAGVGSTLVQTPGRIYMAGPYNGAPFSIVAITSAKVGPFDLGTVVVRVALKIDPLTAAVTVDASASDAIPHIIKGIVVHIRDIRVLVDRSHFSLNPTNCQALTFTAGIGGAGADFTSTADDVTAQVNSPFQVTNCAALKFAPKFSISTSGRTSKANGASLHVNLTYPNAPLGTQANIARVKVDLPKQLPSRLTTLQKACTAAQFNTNPAGCPAASFIGQAKAVTPLIPVPLEGPAIFVSHGGEAFPSLIMVLQGYGVTIDLVGSTFISKSGITSSTFKTVPDQPIGSFELTLPEGKYSALAANGNLCASSLTMPTEFLAQNGAKINQNTHVNVTGCAKKKGLTREQKLAAALKACKKKAKGKRAACRASARKRYGPLAKKKTKSKAKKK
jgi:hypothetical protein